MISELETYPGLARQLETYSMSLARTAVAAVAGAFAFLALSVSAHAIPFTYSYVGLAFLENDVSGNQAAGNRVLGTFTINALTNVGIAEGDNTSLVTAASFSDGLKTLSLGDAGVAITFLFGTDSQGDIVVNDDLAILIDATDGGDQNYIGVNAALDFGGATVSNTGVDKAFGPGSEDDATSPALGVFTHTSDVAEPGSFVLLGIGLLGLSGLMRKRRRTGTA